MNGACHLILSHKTLKNGLKNIAIYARINGSPVRVSTGVHVFPEDWDPVSKSVRGKEKVKKNLILQKKLSEANKIISDFLLMGIDLTPKRFKQELQRPASREDFLAYFREKSKANYDRRLMSKGTHLTELRTARKLETWSGGKIPFSSVCREWLEEFDAWHSQQQNLSGAQGLRAREKSLKHIKKYLKAAKDSEEGYDFRWPFHGFKWPRYRSSPVYLTEEEVQQLWELKEKPDEIMLRMLQRARALEMFDWNVEQYANPEGVRKVQRVITWFLVQCFTGMRYSDLQAVTWRNIEGDYLVFTPVKTRDTSGTEVRMYLSKPIRELLPSKPKNIHLPIWDVITNQKYNTYLKEIAQLAKIDKRITSHVGRHTFATMSLKRGIHLNVLKELMGVTKIETVMIYAHASRKQLDDAMKMAFGEK